MRPVHFFQASDVVNPRAENDVFDAAPKDTTNDIYQMLCRVETFNIWLSPLVIDIGQYDCSRLRNDRLQDLLPDITRLVGSINNVDEIRGADLSSTEFYGVRSRFKTDSRHWKLVDQCLKFVSDEAWPVLVVRVVHINPKRLLCSVTRQIIVAYECLSQALGERTWVWRYVSCWLAMGNAKIWW